MKKAAIIITLIILLISCKGNLTKEEKYCISKWWEIKTKELNSKKIKFCFINDWLDWISCEINLFFENKCWIKK